MYNNFTLLHLATCSLWGVAYVEAFLMKYSPEWCECMVPKSALPLVCVYTNIAEVIRAAVREQLTCITYSLFAINTTLADSPTQASNQYMQQ